MTTILHLEVWMFTSLSKKISKLDEDVEILNIHEGFRLVVKNKVAQ
jgi:hypothetical protein